jgi:hypothetical protein
MSRYSAAVLLALCLGGLTLVPRARAAIYWPNIVVGPTAIPFTGGIARANIDGTSVNQELIPYPVQGDTGNQVAVDGAHVYFTSIGAGYKDIYRANLDGSEAHDFIGTESLVVTGLAVDGTHIYWVTPYSIGRANLDGTGVNANFIVGALGPVAVDSTHIYWTNGPDIARANLDGTGINEHFIATGVAAFTAALSLAVGNGHIYWTYSGEGRIGRAKIDGSEVTPNFITAEGVAGVAVDKTYIYWTSLAAYLGTAGRSGSIGRANLDGTGVNQNLITCVEPKGALAVDAVAIPRVPNPPCATIPTLPSGLPIFPNVSVTFGEPSAVVARLPAPAGTGNLGAESASINWGDGTTTPATLTPGASGGANVSAVHTYWTAGIASLTVTVTGPAGSTTYNGDAEVVSTYVGMGDSYSSGEGAHWEDGGPPNAGCSWHLYTDPWGSPENTDFVFGRTGSKCETDTQTVPARSQPNDTCHRAVTAYPHVLEKTLAIPGMSLSFVACSGDVVHDAYIARDDFEHHESAQVAGLSHGDSLVTLGFGGNDLGFADVVKACASPVASALDCLAREETGLRILGFDTRPDSYSDGQLGSAVDAHRRSLLSRRLLRRLHLPSGLHCLLAGGACVTRALTSAFARADPANLPAGLLSATDTYSQTLNLHDRLVLLLRVVKALAPGARILILGYPRWFPTGGSGGNDEHFSNFEQTWINDRIGVFDGLIRDAALQSGVAQYVDVYGAFNGHEEANTTTIWPVDSVGNAICNGPGTYINGLDLLRGKGGTPEVMHPNPCGHQAFAALAAAAFAHPPGPSDSFSLGMGRTHHSVVTIGGGTSRETITVQSSNAGLSTTLTGPHGRRPAIRVVPTLSGAVFATWTLVNPTPGRWTLAETNRSPGGGAINAQVTADLPRAPELPPGAFVTFKDHRKQHVGCHATLEAHLSHPSRVGQVKSFSWFDDHGNAQTDVGGNRNDRMTMDSRNNHFELVLRVNGPGPNSQHRYELIDMHAPRPC